MSSMYAMQRANGDWFALDDHGRLRVPVFLSSNEAMEARAHSFEMLLFKPVVIDERALDDLAQTETEGATGFLLVNNLSGKLNRGHRIEHAQLARLIREAA